MVSLDYSLGIQIVNFLLLIFILNVLLYKPILGMIDRRKIQLEESESEIKRLQESVEQKMAAYEEKLRQAKAAAVEQKNEIIGRGAEEAKTVIEFGPSEEAIKAYRAKRDIEAGLKLMEPHLSSEKLDAVRRLM